LPRRVSPAVEIYNRARRGPPLPRPAARLLTAEDVCCLSQQKLSARGFGKSLPAALRALVDAGFMSKQPGASRVPDTYRLLLPLEAQP